MSIEMTEEIKRWTAKRKSALVLETIKGKTTVSEASRQYDLSPSEVEDWILFYNTQRSHQALKMNKAN